MKDDVRVKVKADTAEARAGLASLRREAEGLAIAMSEVRQKPGYKTTEFYLTLAAVAVGLFLASGALPDTHWAVKLAGFVGSALASMGYAYNRTQSKM